MVISTEQRNTVAASECSEISSALLSTEATKSLATPDKHGDVVVDKESNIILGFSVATLDQYVSPFKHVTFCLRLNHALKSLCDMYYLRIGTFRTFES